MVALQATFVAQRNSSMIAKYLCETKGEGSWTVFGNIDGASLMIHGSMCLGSPSHTLQ